MIREALRITPPRRERLWRSASAKDREGQDEQYEQTRAVETRRDEVRVVFVNPWTVVAEIPLYVESSEERG